MLIDSVSFINVVKLNQINASNRKPAVDTYNRVGNPDKFEKNSISFGNLQSAITDIAAKNLKNLTELEDSFNLLMKELIKDKSLKRSPYFSYLETRFQQSGFRGLLGNFRMPKSTPDVDTLVEKSAGEGLDLVSVGEDPVLSLYNFGRHGFWASITDSKSATRDMRLFFSNAEKKKSKQAILEFTMDKKGNYFITQRVGEDYRETAFYASTGNKRLETYCYGGGKPDTTYYNADGSKAFFENWLYGGTPTEPIY